MKKQLINKMEMTLPSKSENERFARQSVGAFIIPLDPTVNELADIRTAVSEAVTNCVVHGYRKKEGLIYISVKCFSDRSVVLKIRDKGCGIEDIEKCKQPLYTTDQSGERGGMGFAIMESFTDKMTVKSSLGKGTVITLVKKLS